MKNLIFGAAIFIIAQSTIAAPLYNNAQLCQATIAMNNGHGIKEVKVLSSKKDKVFVSYLRDDGRHFKFTCKISSSEISYADEYVGWLRVRFYYKILESKMLEIHAVDIWEGNTLQDETMTFSTKDFK